MERKWQILIAIALGTAVVPINAGIVNVSLPSITEFFNVSVATAQWVLTAYLLFMLSLVLFFGRVGDSKGHERLYMLGLVFFILSSLLCSSSPSIYFLIIFRAVQGVAAAMMISVSLGIVKKSFPTEELGRALGIYAVAIAAGLALGPAIGGLIESWGGWRSIFLLNIPLCALSLILCYFILDRNTGEKVKWDLTGTFLQFSCLFSIVYGLNYIQREGIDMITVFIGFFALFTLIMFIWNERRVDEPLLNLSLFRKMKFSAFNLALFLNYLCMYMVFFIMPFYLQKVLHLGSNVTGMVLTAAPVIMMFMAPLSGSLSDKMGSRYLAFTGSIISALALFSMTQLTIFSSLVDVTWRFALLGVGAAFFQSPNNRAIMAHVPDKASGMVSSIIVTMRNLGMVFAVSFAGLLLYTTITPSTLQSPVLYNLAAYDFTTGMHRVVIFGGIISIIMAILSLAGLKKEKIKEKLDLDYVKDRMDDLVSEVTFSEKGEIL
ncbi:MAG: MFS transporter [Methanobacteriaceae archaeon]|nr:MFS transporter [Methanobacteriaceae archaeon]